MKNNENRYVKIQYDSNLFSTFYSYVQLKFFDQKKPRKLETEFILDDGDNIDGNIDDDGSFGNDGEVVVDGDISDGANFSKNFSAMTSSCQTF